MRIQGDHTGTQGWKAFRSGPTLTLAGDPGIKHLVVSVRDTYGRVTRASFSTRMLPPPVYRTLVRKSAKIWGAKRYCPVVKFTPVKQVTGKDRWNQPNSDMTV